MFLSEATQKIYVNEYQNKLFKLQTKGNVSFENSYIQSLIDVLNYGIESSDRTGTGTIRLNSGFRFILHDNEIPLLRGKYVNPYNALTETIWILTGRNDVKWLKDNGVNYWDSWVLEDGTFGPIYGPQMRNSNGFDQLLYVIKKLTKEPNSRQAVINLWNGSDLHKMALPVCHNQYHPLILNGKLNLHCGQRSADSFLGVPYDYMLFYFIQNILCYLTNTKPGLIVHTNNDYHMYSNHYDSVINYIDNYIHNPDKKVFTEKIYIDLSYPEKPAELTSETLTQWLYDFYELNKKFQTNYTDKNIRYGHVKADVAV